MDLFRDRRWDLVGKSWLWYTISAVVIGLGLIVWIGRGLNLGVDFTGGAILKYEFETELANAPGGEAGAMSIARDAARSVPGNYTKCQVQVADDKWLIVRIGELEGEKQLAAQVDIREALAERLSDSCGAISESADVEFVGPVIGEDLRRGAVWALLLGCGGILVYISIRYKFRFAVAAICALVHDVLILCGAMALLGVELNSPFVAAILTVIGYSINDTVVIFDRIRENMSIHRQAPFASTVNASLLQTMARSINTVATTLFTLTALCLFGGATIESFALALIIGIASGCYSSIFTASQLLVTWQRMWEAGKSTAIWWRAIVALVPTLFLGLLVFPFLNKTSLAGTISGSFPIQVGICAVLYVLGFLIAGLIAHSALRVLAGVAATRTGSVAASPARANAAALAAGAAVPESGRGLSAEGKMHAASSEATAQARAERRERRKARKAREASKPGKRKRRF